MSKYLAGYQLPLPVSEPPLEAELREPLDVEGRLSELLKQDLTFSGAKTNSATHRLHTFPAKFPPQLPFLFINDLTRPHELVLDPMCGSGTALVEAALCDRFAIGIDLDPLAVLIAHIKSTPIDLTQCAQTGTDVVKNAARKVRSVSDNDLAQFYAPDAIKFFRYWYEEHTVNELFPLIQEILSIDDKEIRAFLLVVFSSAIINKHGILTRARDLGHSRPHRDLHKTVIENAIDFFGKRLEFALQVMESIRELKCSAIVARSDAKRLPLLDNSVDLIVTSPPYAANAIDYMRANKFSLLWFGNDPRTLTELRRRYIGSEIRVSNCDLPSATGNRVIRRLEKTREERAAVVAHYYHDIVLALREMLRVLKEGRAAILVVGSSTIQGIEIHAPTVIAELAEAEGFRLVGVAKREILRNSRMMPASHNTTRDGIEARMHEEGVIGLVKPTRVMNWTTD